MKTEGPKITTYRISSFTVRGGTKEIVIRKRLSQVDNWSQCRTGMVGLAPTWVRLAPNGTNPGFFRSAPAPNALKSDLKSPGFVPFRANLTHFGAKPSIPTDDGLPEDGK